MSHHLGEANDPLWIKFHPLYVLMAPIQNAPFERAQIQEEVSGTPEQGVGIHTNSQAAFTEGGWMGLIVAIPDSSESRTAPDLVGNPEQNFFFLLSWFYHLSNDSRWKGWDGHVALGTHCRQEFPSSVPSRLYQRHSQLVWMIGCFGGDIRGEKEVSEM